MLCLRREEERESNAICLYNDSLKAFVLFKCYNTNMKNLHGTLDSQFSIFVFGLQILFLILNSESSRLSDCW